jgi:PAS domain S-box-containing protein
MTKSTDNVRTAAGPPLGIISLCAAIIAVLWAALIFDIERSQRAAIKQAGSDAVNLAMAFRENVKRTIGAIDQLMLMMIAENNQAKNPYRIAPWVMSSPLLKGMSVQVSISGPDGIMVASSLGYTQRVDISDRPHFRYHLDPSAPQPYISVPVIGRNSGRWSIQVTRRITRPDGSFGGVIVVSIDPFYFSKFFDSVNLGQNGVVDLFGGDGIVRSRRSRVSAMLGRSVAGTMLFKTIARSSNGSLITDNDLDGINRVFGYTSVPGYPLFVAVGLAVDDVLAPVRRQRVSYFVIGAVLTLAISALGWFLAREIRRRRERELALVAEEHVKESVRMLFEYSPVPMFVIDCDDLRFLAVNATAVVHYGYSREQFLAMTKLDIHPPEERGAYAEAFRAFRESERAEFEWQPVRRHRKADGTEILVQVYGRRLDYNGRSALLCSVIDITERLVAEQERDRNRDFLHSVIENVGVTIIAKDAKTLNYILVNKAAEKMWGVSRDAVLGKTSHQVFDVETARSIDKYDRQLLQTSDNFYVPPHRVMTLHNGSRVVASNHLLIRDQNGEPQYLVGVIEDVTERKAVEDQLRQAQKMEAIGKLTGGVAHDFNNLLTIIMGNLDLLSEGLAGNAAAEETIGVILEAAERGADLARHMLAFSRRQPLQAKPADVNALIATTQRMVGRTLGENIAIEVRAAADLPAALVDPSQLETALLNIAINARDAMPDGGVLTISTRLASLDEAYMARHPGLAVGRYVAIEMADTGIGMAPDLLEQIFEPFFTTKAAGHGTGLGLSMVYGFIKQSGGHIAVYSEIGHGTVFKLFLPLASVNDCAAAAQSDDGLPGKSEGNEVILAVEDNPDIRSTVVRQLRDLGYRVREADSAEAALRILAEPEPIDLLFTDMIMPGGLNGKQLATMACASRLGLKVLFTSGFTGTSTIQGAQLEPGDVLLSKPYRKADLAKAVHEALLRAA